jgi:seryl-tRNA synthetase
VRHNEVKPSEGSQRSAVIDRLVQVRKEQETALPPLAAVKAEALSRLEEVREKFKAAEAEYRRVADEYSSKAEQLAGIVRSLEMELHELTPTVGDFLHRLSNIVGGAPRHQMTSAQMLEVFRLRDQAQALWEEPADGLAQRLADLESSIPVIS